MDSYNANALVIPIKVPIPTIIKITKSIQPATDKYFESFVVVDLSVTFRLVFISIDSGMWFAFTFQMTQKKVLI